LLKAVKVMMTTRAALASVLLVFSASFVPTPAIAQSLDDLKKQYRRPLSIPFPKESPYSPQIATLGKNCSSTPDFPVRRI
jgi:hypothetical protein